MLSSNCLTPARSFQVHHLNLTLKELNTSLYEKVYMKLKANPPCWIQSEYGWPYTFNSPREWPLIFEFFHFITQKIIAEAISIDWLKLVSCDVQSEHHGSVWFGSVRKSSVRFGLVRFGSEKFGSVRKISVRKKFVTKSMRVLYQSDSINYQFELLI